MIDAVLIVSAVAALLALVLSFRAAAARRKEAAEPPSPADPAAGEREGEPMGDEETPPEFVAAWVQFLKGELIEATNALNNRLNVILANVGFDARNLTGEQRNKLQQIRVEVGRAAQISAGLLRKVSSSVPETAPAVLHEYDGSKFGPAAVLLVESDDANRSVIVRLLERLGLSVTAVSNGLEAYEVLQQGLVDCVISDVRLQFVGGRTLFEQIEQNMPHMASRFVFATGDHMNPESREFLDRTGQPVIGKPYEPEALLGAVAAILRKVSAVSPNRGR